MTPCNTCRNSPKFWRNLWAASCSQNTASFRTTAKLTHKHQTQDLMPRFCFLFGLNFCQAVWNVYFTDLVKEKREITTYPVCSIQNFKIKESFCISYKRKLCIGTMSFDSNGRNLKHSVGCSVKGEADWRRNCRYMPHPQKGTNVSLTDLEMQILWHYTKLKRKIKEFIILRHFYTNEIVLQMQPAGI